MSTNSEIPKQSTDWITDLGLRPSERANVTRRGERVAIPKWIRQLVHRRDNWTCQHCRATPFARTRDRYSGVLHVDHIVPWSAGGSDRTDNLRTLCKSCNEDRSNFVTGYEQPAIPIVRICAPCLTGAPVPPDGEIITVFCAHCHCESWALPGWQIL